ncbi:iron-siderophore ABC transporter substrate-binding protein [Ancylobacter sp. MQZ15Z-1]|uniref:Iron-siderophore ABC transporter substrate-binding protein n=1 Tax=Ancylobacter mangrovi TaxID=2972472 RepID=A0A9X2PMJ2_9HYPH|nr:iron-siderophore ABC transporter substrate-binding protein [Ancylobacter mangrovi]MCS0496528.1 iron-siderophore ABC transporter substrate-binding protein [Ancylobacter mangrovi]
MLGGLAAGVLARPFSAAAVTAGSRPRIAAMDFGLAETLIEMGLPPIAVPDPNTWADWVVEPPLPADIVNLGTDREPNLELLAALKPDLIVTTPFLDDITPLLERFAPTRTFSVYAPPPGPIYARSVAATRELAGAVGMESAGEDLISRAQTVMDEVREHLAAAGLGGRSLLIVQFLDTRHVRVYGRGSLFGDVLERCGLTNGWPRASNYWGFNTVGIEELSVSPASGIAYLEPIAPDTLDRLAASPLWNRLPAVESGRIYRLPAALMFGMLPAAMRFARQISLVLGGAPSNG